METSQLGTFNVIPGHVLLVGTVRTFKQETRDLAERRVREIATQISQALGTSAESSTAEATRPRSMPNARPCSRPRSANGCSAPPT
jgi:metal-dependent amidase/aminoacylase/carboxypeptidase family protein